MTLGGRRTGPYGDSSVPDRGGRLDLTPSQRSSGSSHGGGHGGHHGGGYDRHHRHTRSCGHWDWYFGLGYWGPSYSFGLGYWGLPYYSYYYSPYYPYYTPYSPVVVYGDPQGALDLNIKPKTTEVFVDGYFVGTTGDFDGWPRYLWLSDDVHEIILYLEGYETVVREVSVRAGEVIDMRFRMASGPSTPPEEITRFGSAPSPAGAYASTAPPSAAPAPAPSGPPAELDLRTEAGRVQLRISPGEASVYVDGRFVGIAGELAAVRDGLLMDPGEHTLQVFHPGHESVERPFVVEAGETIELKVELRP